MKKVIILMMLTILLAACGGKTEEKKFPNKPIELLMPWPAGGSSDTQARVLIQSAREELGVPMVIVDRSGSGGIRGAMEGKNAKADGYTVLWASGGMFTLTPNLMEVGYSIEDFKPILGATLEHTLIVTSKDSDIKSLDDLKNKGLVTYGSPGATSGPGKAISLLMDTMGIEANHVPFGGSNQSSAAALGGHVDIADSKTAILSGMPDLRILAVLSKERTDLLPDVPTAYELGYDVVLESYNGFYVPKNTSDEVVDILGKGFKKMLNSDDFNEFVVNSKIEKFDVEGNTLKNKVITEYNMFKGLIRAE